MYHCNTVKWAWLDWGLSGWLTTLLQCFDTVGWVIRPVKTIGHITYIVLVQTWNYAQSICGRSTTTILTHMPWTTLVFRDTVRWLSPLLINAKKLCRKVRGPQRRSLTNYKQPWAEQIAFSGEAHLLCSLCGEIKDTSAKFCISVISVHRWFDCCYLIRHLLWWDGKTTLLHR